MANTRTGIRVAQPLYLQLAERLAESINQGKYPVGAKLPTEAELRTEFGASRFTVREAVKQLQALGLVATRQGTGTEVVARHATSGRFTYSFDSIHDFLHSARETRLTDLQIDEVKADKNIADAMHCEPGHPLLRIRATRVLLTPKRRRGRAVALVEVHVLGAYKGIRSELEHLDSTISEIIENRYAISTARIEQSLEPCAVDAEEAQALDVQAGSLGLRVQRQYISTRGEVFEYATSTQAGDEARIQMSIRSRETR